MKRERDDISQNKDDGVDPVLRDVIAFYPSQRRVPLSTERTEEALPFYFT